MHRTIVSTLVLAAALWVTSPVESSAIEHFSGCGIPVLECPHPAEYPQYDNQCKSMCGIFSYPGGCGVSGPPYNGLVVWCYQPN